MECSSQVRKLEIKQICKLIDENYDSSIHVAVLMCEGDENSIDAKIYSKIYPYFYIIPSGGCSDIAKLIPSIRKRNEEILIFGLIDRDANSKKEIRQLRENMGIYCTKLPFIENIICAPEVIKILCKYLNIDFERTIKTIKESLLKAWISKLKDAFPMNVSILRDDLIESASILIKKKDGTLVEKTISESNILYRYRDKAIASIVADALLLKGRQAYYDFIKKMLEEPIISNDILKAMRAYLPMIKV